MGLPGNNGENSKNKKQSTKADAKIIPTSIIRQNGDERLLLI